jgi:hypothetical protein
MSNSTQIVIYQPNEHADQYLVFIEDVAEVSACMPAIQPDHFPDRHLAHKPHCLLSIISTTGLTRTVQRLESATRGRKGHCPRSFRRTVLHREYPS